MSVSRPQLRDELRQIVGTVFSDAQMNSGIDLAIDAAWPEIHKVKEDTSITLAKDFYSYALSATDITDRGVAQVYIARDDMPDPLLRRVSQACINGQWRLYFQTDHVRLYVGETVRVVYLARHPRLADEATLTDVPVPWVVYYAAAHLALQASTDRDHYNVEAFSAAAPVWMKIAETIKNQYRSHPVHRYVAFTA